MEKQLSMFDTGAVYDTGKNRPCDYSFVREVGMKVRRWRTGEISEITEIFPYYTHLSDGTVATPYDIAPWDDSDRLIVIPDDIWSNRCAFCVHKAFNINWPFPASMIDKPVERPCRIIRLFKSTIPGECVNFRPNITTRGICYSCRHDNQFTEGFCMNTGHAKQHRIYCAGDSGGDQKKREYWGKHIQSVCSDYSPKEFVKGDCLKGGCFQDE